MERLLGGGILLPWHLLLLLTTCLHLNLTVIRCLWLSVELYLDLGHGNSGLWGGVLILLDLEVNYVILEVGCPQLLLHLFDILHVLVVEPLHAPELLLHDGSLLLDALSFLLHLKLHHFNLVLRLQSQLIQGVALLTQLLQEGLVFVAELFAKIVHLFHLIVLLLVLVAHFLQLSNNLMLKS